MDACDKWKFSPEAEDRLKKFCLKLENEKSEVTNIWLALLNYKCSPLGNCQIVVDDTKADREEEILRVIKKCMESTTVLPENTFVEIPLNSLNRILLSVHDMLDDFGFCTFCKFIAQWNNDSLIEHSLKCVVFKKLNETIEASGCVIFAVKELALSKPNEFCQNVLIPLLTSDTSNFSDMELLSGIFSVLPAALKDILVKKFTKKAEFLEKDWRLLLPVIKDLSQNSLLNLLECIQKFSPKFTKSTVFGRLLVNFCKNFEFIGNKDVLREIVEKHESLLKTQAMKYLNSV